MALVQPGVGVERNAWNGVVIENKHAFPINEIRLIGPQMPVFHREAIHEKPNRGPDDRWSRQSGALGETIFQRFRQLNAILIGAGRLGSLIAEGLIRSGLQRLTVVDPDVLEPHNLNATIGSRNRDIGKPKVQSLLRYLHRVQPRALLCGLQRQVDHPDVFEKARAADLLVSCVDNDEARHQAAARPPAAVALGSEPSSQAGCGQPFRTSRPYRSVDTTLSGSVRIFGCCPDVV